MKRFPKKYSKQLLSIFASLFLAFTMCGTTAQLVYADDLEPGDGDVPENDVQVEQNVQNVTEEVTLGETNEPGDVDVEGTDVEGMEKATAKGVRAAGLEEGKLYVGGQDIVRVGGTVTGEDGQGTAVLSYDNNNNLVLTLNGYECTNCPAGGDVYEGVIDYQGSEALTIELDGNNVITAGSGLYCGFYSSGEAAVTITGSGQLSATGPSGDMTNTYGISARNLIIMSGTVTAKGGNTTSESIFATSIGIQGGITINGGSVTATAGNAEDSYGIYGTIIINGGTVKATGTVGTYGYGIFGNTTIGKEITSVEVKGIKGAFHPDRSVKNYVSGTGWSNPEGTEGKTVIDVNTEGGTLPYKRVVFTHNHDEITFEPWTSTDSLPTDAGSYCLTQDVTLSGTWIVPKGTTDLCLNDHSITYNGDTTATVISSVDSAALNLYDCGTTLRYYYIGSDGLGHVVDSDNNEAYIAAEKKGTLNGGYITGGVVRSNGAGLFVNPTSSVTMNGGTIIGNKCDGNGGGVCVTGGTFAMNGGNIIGNTAGTGGGVYVSKDIDNAFNISGSPVVTDNTADGKADNVYLPAGKKIAIANTLADSTSIGVTMEHANKFTNGLNGNLPNGKEASDLFSSDDSAYEVMETDDGEAKLATPLTITAKDQTYVYNGYEQGEGDPAYDDAAVIAEKVVVDGLRPGDTLASLIMTGSAKEVGVYRGRIEVTGVAIKNASGDTVTDSYDITFVPGTLTISKPEPKPTPKPTPKPMPSVDKATAKIAIDAGIKGTSSGSKVTARWGKVEKADSYVVYAGFCGKDFHKVKEVSGKTNKIVITKVGNKKVGKENVKYYVVAYQTVKGKKVQVARSIIAHVAGAKHKKYTNPKSIKVKKSAYTLKKGKTAKIKPKLVLQKEGKKTLKHETKFRYATSNKKVAAVNKKGKIKAVGKGNCTVYVYAQNGCAKAIKVKVK